MIHWNPYDRETQADPYPVYRWMRDFAPVYCNDDIKFYALSRYADVMAAHLDFATFSSAHGTTIDRLDGGIDALLTKDPPEHTWHRRLIARVFTARQMECLEPMIRDVAGRLLDQGRDAGEIDIVADFSAKLPMSVIAELVGIPLELRDRVHELSDMVVSRDESTPDGVFPDDGVRALFEMFGLMIELVEARRRHPGDDVLSMLIQTEVADDEGRTWFLTDEQLAGRVVEMAIAGHETVTKLIGSGALALSKHPETRRRICDDRSLIPKAVEEMLRLDPPVQYQGRWTTRAVELHGVAIPSDCRVLLVTASATHDDRIYSEPERFDIDRPIDRQLGFGFGAHLCLGAPLARLESRLAFDVLLDRYPEYEIDETRSERTYGSIVRGFNRLPMVLGPSAVVR